MTLIDYKSRLRAYERWEVLSLCFSAALLVSLLVRHFTGRTSIVVSAVLSVTAVGSLVLWFRGGRPRHLRRLLCPSCGKHLVDRNAKAVLNTGKCGHCGTQILESE